MCSISQRGRSPSYLSASSGQTWAREEAGMSQGVLVTLQRLCPKALKTHLVVVVAVKSIYYILPGRSSHLEPWHCHLFWEPWRRTAVLCGKWRWGTNSYWYEAMCRVNWTGYYGFYNLLSLDEHFLIFFVSPASSNIRFKEAMTGKTSYFQAEWWKTGGKKSILQWAILSFLSWKQMPSDF